MPAKEATILRCPNCRSAVPVPETFVEGDLLRCGTCGLSLKVHKGGGLRLQIADAAPLRDEIKVIQQRLHAFEADRASARLRLGLGIYGPVVGLLWAIYQVTLKDQQLSLALLEQAVGAALLGAIGLEIANFLFLGKRREISRLSRGIRETRAHLSQLQSRVRDSERR